MFEEIENKELGTKLLYQEMPYKTIGSIVICAGGAYVWLSDREEWPVANCYAIAGYQTYILKYTTGAENPVGTLPLRQLAWAVKTARERATDQNKFVAVCGFSAGGHLCATLGVHWNDGEKFSKEEQSLIRPDAMILGYAATNDMDFHGLDDSEFRKHLYGDDEIIRKYLNCVDHVTNQTPPSFVWHTIQDEMVPVQMSIDFVQKLVDNGVYTEFHLFPDGPHGLSVATPNVDDPPKNRFSDSHIAEWMSLSQQWLSKVAERVSREHSSSKELV